MSNNYQLTGECILNKSTAKQLYSFPKSKRFKKQKKPVCDIYYDIPEKQSQRTTSFGIGERFKRKPKYDSDAVPISYINANEEYIKSIIRKKGYSFGESRDAYKNVYQKYQTKIGDPKMPGPGFYNVESFVDKIKKNNKNFTLFKKEAYNFYMNYPQVPGPGTYQDQLQINKNGNYHLSSIPNSGAQKFATENAKYPGPGTYSPKLNINQEGLYYLSNYRNSLTRKFGTPLPENTLTSFRGKKRNSFNNNSTPGPGTYKVFSEFGKYNNMENSENKRQYSLINGRNHILTRNIHHKRAQSAVQRTNKTYSKDLQFKNNMN